MFTEQEILEIRKDFPILQTQVYGKPLVYLDNAATAQKPLSVIEAEKDYYLQSNSNIHRGVHYLSEKASQAYEDTRAKVARFINAKHESECIFTRNTTESINLVAQSYGRHNLKQGDEVIITELDHHSNIIPWQTVCEQTGAKLKVVHLDDNGDLLLNELNELLNKNTKIVALSHVSNSLGTINPLESMIKTIREHSNAIVVVDGAQATPHMKVDVQTLDCDFYALSAHKVFGPTGVGVLYGKKELLEDMPPYQVGGGMVTHVSLTTPTYHKVPMKFEAGTPNIAGVIAFAKAIDYMDALSFEKITAYEQQLLFEATTKINQLSNFEIIGTAKHKASVISLNCKNAHPHDVCTIIDQEGVAVRGGTHCTVPALERFGLPSGTVRASFCFYNTMQEVDALINALKQVEKLFS